MAARAGILKYGLAGLGLAALAWFAFGGAAKCGFVHFDDDLYVYENAPVREGLTWAGVRWAFTTGHASNWHPLTWLSLMADTEFQGPEPAGYHRTNVGLHALNAILLFWALRRLTGRFGAALAVAALWAAHPLRAESVAWISERKDVLAAFFGLLALGAYGGGPGPRSGKRLAAVAGFFALSLLAKPAWVTLPFLLLVLDAWPLRRWPEAGAARLVREKLPLFLLAAGSCAVTYFVQRAGAAVVPVPLAPTGVRLANACVAYGEYVRLLFWPFRLAVFYPHLGADLPAARVALSALALALLTGGAAAQARRRPWWLAGWLWFLGTLVPMIGLVQVGGQGWADRYTYLPHVGLLLALVWGAAEWAARPAAAWRRGLAAALAAAAVAGCLGLARAQTRVWRDTETLFRGALANTRNNARMEMNLGAWYLKEGRFWEAREHLLRSLALQPLRNEARYNLANLDWTMGRKEDSIRGYRAVLAENPEHTWALNNLARILATDPRAEAAQAEEALALARRAVATAKPPENWNDTLALAHWKRGRLLAAEGRAAEAEEHFRSSLQAKPAGNRAAFDLALLRQETGPADEAIRSYRAALAAWPDHADALNNLAWLLASDPAADAAQAAEALALARRAAAAPHPTPERLDTLALALAATGDFDDAAAAAAQARDLARNRGQAALANEIERRRAGYAAGKIVRE